MDLATLIGLLGGLTLVTVAILMGGDLGAFIDIPSIVIVVGGSIMASLMRYSLGQFIGAVGVMAKAFMFKSVAPSELIAESVQLANVVRKEGVLALEGKDVSHPFLKKGIALCIDGHGPEVVHHMMRKDMLKTAARHETGSNIFKALGDAAPAMGMIGTLIGLVQMLGNMDDPKAIGPAMAIALLTTLYGAILANVIFLPIADKLKLRAAEEAMSREMIHEAISGIQEGVNPRILEQLLYTYMPESKREER